ncbi:lipopolysaccharide biosynthesis protein [Neolewinella litorea]|uniref:Polysaccharide biosynthesis protein n=1 Tax=Neolewinella litorea TaxID=2562452 RepID=A0A4S4NKG3_9BACT|nr:polysaccharide biosynthesis protein [Neolewinella litorea]THH39287.1 polysaccharide biosynthesis protein [Neolewinella litorea]
MAARAPQLVKWGKLVSVTGGAQLLIQGVGFICGIFIIHVLSTEQYAYYTLANTMLGTMTVLADGGISTGVMSEGGKNWRDKPELGKILATGMHMRRQFAVGSLLVSVPILYYLLQEQGVVWWQSILLILCLTPTFWAQLSGSLLQTVPKLHQDINDLLKVNVQINVLRLLITIPSLLFFPFAAVAILASGASQVRGNLQFRELSLRKADWQTGSSEYYRKRILKTVKRILPGSIYYCVSGQITVWLIAIFSTTESIAQIGALSRLMMLLTLVRLSIDMLIVPRYARLPPDRRVIILRFFQVLGLLLVLSAFIVGAVYLFPDIFLWILGSKYQDLETEVVLMTLGSCLMMISGVAHVMSSSRGIIPNPYLFIAATILTQVFVLYFLVDYTTLSGVILFSVYSAILTIAYRIVDFLYRTLVRNEGMEEEDPSTAAA